jgi:hypothetical protein
MEDIMELDSRSREVWMTIPRARSPRYSEAEKTEAAYQGRRLEDDPRDPREPPHYRPRQSDGVEWPVLGGGQPSVYPDDPDRTELVRELYADSRGD